MPRIGEPYEWGNPWEGTELEDIINELIQKTDENRERLTKLETIVEGIQEKPGMTEKTIFSTKGIGGMEKLFENKKLNVSARTVRRGEEVLFYAKDVAESLGYNKPRNAVRIHVWEEDKCTLGSLRRGPAEGPLYKGQPETVLIIEQGLYQLIFGSELKHAKDFRR
ncbi:Hypothetical predicted protein [Paramuricea clavata]|uniref:Uncharacterized protein n=1 Tax=Paramuricea clavata TaxID=317549 RepID=A0A7D9J5C3_PARCT|nr:Hypothetical predicted protein [Paramuricea clavata]